MGKVRIDKLLLERGLAASRQKACALIMAGCVLIGDTVASKPGQMIDRFSEIRLRGSDHPYVGRGGVKLAHALDFFGVNVCGKICMDVGASTGGFTDCLLKRGSKRVYAIDVGYGQLAWKIASDERVVVVERTNIRKLSPEKIPEKIEIAVADVSFISLAIVLPAVDLFLADEAYVIALVKPQFEVGRELVGKGGIVKDAASHELAVEQVRQAGKKLEWIFEGVVESPITGAKGNKEFLIHFRRRRNAF